MPNAPAVQEERSVTPALPVDIPQFSVVKEKVTSGTKPFPDGFAWLKKNGYRAVLHVVQPGESDTIDRKLIENNDLKYLSLEVSPQTIGQAAALFNRIVDDAGNQPLFVYDRDGTLSGSLWYLHFRTIERTTDDIARKRAQALGLKEDTRGENAALWLAIQDYLSKQQGN